MTSYPRHNLEYVCVLLLGLAFLFLDGRGVKIPAVTAEFRRNTSKKKVLTRQTDRVLKTRDSLHERDTRWGLTVSSLSLFFPLFHILLLVLLAVYRCDDDEDHSDQKAADKNNILD